MCKCGCGTCETIRGPLLTEGKVKVKSLLSENLQYHLDKNIPLFESVFRIGSDAHLNLIREARKMYSRDIIDLCEEDEQLIKTHLGEFGVYEGEAVPLDLPMLNETPEERLGVLKSILKAFGPLGLLLEVVIALVQGDKAAGDLAKSMNMTYTEALATIVIEACLRELYNRIYKRPIV